MANRLNALEYAGATPWDGMGVPVPRTENVDRILSATGLGWEVGTSALKFRDAAQKWHTAKTAAGQEILALYRTDTGEALDVVGPDYVAHQNREVVEFFLEYALAGQSTLETAGELSGGRYVWAMLDTGQTRQLPGGDTLRGSVLLFNPHQYARAFAVKYAVVRTLGGLTFTQTVTGAPKLWHVARWSADARKEASHRLEVAREEIEAVMGDMETLAASPMSQSAAIRAAARIFKGDPKVPLDGQGPRAKRTVHLFEGAGIGAQLASAQGTRWGLLAAVLQYVDHELGRTQNKRLVNAWLGEGELFKRRALVELLKDA
jgi:phage/plasmid-like protein (TIGR03299 family)